MKVYFYHTQDIQMILREGEKGHFPPHFLYGATLLPEHGVDVVWHKSRLGLSRWKMMLRNAWQILTCKEHFDAVYATHYRGIELIVLLRALGLFRKPVIIWHHQPIITPKAKWREWLGKLFYRGFDAMFFFSQKLIDDSLKSKKARKERMFLGHWGADMPYYDSLMSRPAVIESQNTDDVRFISTGKEMRDIPTMVEAFNITGAQLDIYISPQNGEERYSDLFEKLHLNNNIRVHMIGKLVPDELAEKVAAADCVVICCQETKYTVGLTTVVEALAMGKPMILSRNPQIPVDVDSDQCGISVPYYDVEGWVQAIRTMVEQTEMRLRYGSNSKALATNVYNNAICAKEVSEVIKHVVGD